MEGFVINDEGYSLRGFDADGYPQAQKAIDKYIEDINEMLSKMHGVSEAMMNSALKGTNQQEKIQTYIDETIKELNRVADYFTAFNQGLTQAAINYNTKQGNITTSDVKDAKTQVRYEGYQQTTGVKPFSE